MGIREKIKEFIGDKKATNTFEVIPDSEGLSFVITPPLFSDCLNGTADSYLLLQFTYLQMLDEQGDAEAIPNGFIVSSEIVSALDDDAESLFNLPPRFNGSFETRIEGESFKATFKVHLIPITKAGERVSVYKCKGPYLTLSLREQYRLRPEEYLAIAALNEHNIQNSEQTEDKNLWLIGQLQKAKAAGMDLNLSHFSNINVDHPEKVGLTATEQQDGSLYLAPNFGIGIESDDFESRKWQVADATNKAALRIRDKIVVLDEKKLEATKEILGHCKIPKSQVQEFLKAPSAFIDASLVDLDLGFSVRVKGATKFTFMPFGESDASGVSWFEGEAGAFLPDILLKEVSTDEELVQVNESYNEAQAQGAEQLLFDDKMIDIRDRKKVVAVLKQIKGNFDSNIYPSGGGPSKEAKTRVTVDVIDAEEILSDLHGVVDDAESSSIPINFSSYSRQPYPHQKEGAQWIKDLVIKAINEDANNLHRLQGALLADDMGLGKTYMALVGISEVYRHLGNQDKTCKPVLVVAPLSLLENWEDEVTSTFDKSPFEDIVVLQSGRDLKAFKKQGARAETKQVVDENEHLDEAAIRYSLNIGKSFGAARLDKPKRLVLTTYQTMRDYQFSLCRVDWSIVVFDETQNIKNPNTLQTRAAKGLKADFKLLVTGTPVENSLTDFWCIIDTAQPGLLGSWEEFKARYVLPIISAGIEEEAKIRLEVGQMLRADVGRFMLRRLKEDSLKGLPIKTIFTGIDTSAQADWVYDANLHETMTGLQLQRYDDVIADFQATDVGERQIKALSTLQKLRQLSLHPGLDDEKSLCSGSKKEAEEFISISGKLTIVLKLLRNIQSRDEKVLIFLVNKKLQRLLKIWLQQIFDTSVEIINGDTKAVSSPKGGLTRKGIISNFESRAGFGILIMSPIAAGVGLTVVGANNVIHLERHWNPAKEAQATDRVYRIGQEKPVNIYLPTLLHPQRQSFDVNLDTLLSNKISLKDAVVTPQVVTSEEMSDVLGF